MTLVRPAIHADASAWARMRQSLWPEDGLSSHAHDVRQFFAGKQREPLAVLLATDDSGAAIGFVELSIRNIVDSCTTDHVAYLEGWYVEPHARRRGVGAALVAAAEAWAIERGCTEFGSDALIDNEASALAHQALGFEETARVRCFRKSLVGDVTSPADCHNRRE